MTFQVNLTDLAMMLADGIENGPQAIKERATMSGRPPDDRRFYAAKGDPWGYIRDILGCRMTPQQELVIEAAMKHDRVLVPAANNVGKTHVLGCLGWYFYDAVASLPDEERDLDEQGCILLLPGPDHRTIFDTIYRQMLDLAIAAERRGKLMPGTRSERSPLMDVGPRWFVRAFSPRRQLGKGQAHSAAGRHHRNQVALLEEGAGAEEATWVSVEGMCSAEGNKMVSAANPTERSGPFYDRSLRGDYYTLSLSGLDHPNIIERRTVIPGAIDHRRFDERIRHQCDDMGPASLITPDPLHLDFVYALPTGVSDEPRQDGVRGAAGAEPHVFRPGPVFAAQGLGQWPTTSATGLFDAAAWDRAVERWKQSPEPVKPPDRVGLDAAREGVDDTVCAPAWGKPAAELLAAYRSIQRVTERPVERTTVSEDDLIPGKHEDAVAYLERRARESAETAIEVKSSAEEALDRVRAKNRVRIGRLEVAPKGTGTEVARWAAFRFPESPFAVDDGGVGASVYDQLKDVQGRDAMPVSFGGAPLPEIPGELCAENLRSQMIIRFAELVRLGLVDLPPDPMLRQEAMAHRLIYRQKAVGSGRSRRVRSSAIVNPKDEIKAEIGRSPDRMDAVVLSLMPLQLQRWYVG